MEWFKKKIYLRHIYTTISFFKKADPEVLEKKCSKKLIPAFKRAARRIEGYKKILEEHGVDYLRIRSIADFKKAVPVLSKENIFTPFLLDQLCLDGDLSNLQTIMTSSGFSGNPSFGITTGQDEKAVKRGIDTTLEYLFEISKRKTLVVNCVSMGVHIVTSAALAETSVRSDMALAIIKKSAPYFEQVVVVGDPHFIKKLVEEGISEKVNWEKLNASFIFGGDWFSESLRTYVENLAGITTQPGNNRMIIATYGLTELDLNLFHETPYTVALRKEVQKNSKLRSKLGCSRAAPEFFHYFPHRTFLELTREGTGDDDAGGEGELLFSMLSPALAAPLFRYNSKDRGAVFPYNRIKKILEAYKLAHLISDLKLPLVSVGGRRNRYVSKEGENINPEVIKQGLYENEKCARSTTGYFRLSKKEEQVEIEIQLNKGVSRDNSLQNLFEKHIHTYLDSEIKVKLYPYFQFPYGMELDYEKKFVFV